PTLGLVSSVSCVGSRGRPRLDGGKRVPVMSRLVRLGSINAEAIGRCRVIRVGPPDLPTSRPDGVDSAGGYIVGTNVGRGKGLGISRERLLVRSRPGATIRIGRVFGFTPRCRRFRSPTRGDPPLLGGRPR